jgi:ribosomal protein S18 acetylase RimI-like enzyme
MVDPSTFTVRIATHEDVSRLAELGRETFRVTFENDNTPENMQAYLAQNFSVDQVGHEVSDPRVTFLLAEQSGNLVGYAKLRAGKPDAAVTGKNPIELERLYVRSEAIGLGVGARLLRECIDIAAKRGFDTLWLGVWENNPRALRFYQKWGFTVVGSHVFQLGSDAQTDLIMQKSVQT